MHTHAHTCTHMHTHAHAHPHQVWAAKRRGIHLELTLGNLWPAYKGPEEFLAQATGSAGGRG